MDKESVKQAHPKAQERKLKEIISELLRLTFNPTWEDLAPLRKMILEAELPKGKPPLLSEKQLHFTECNPPNPLLEDIRHLTRRVAQAQYDICVKHYEGLKW